jgi:hypothetical protein
MDKMEPQIEEVFKAWLKLSEDQKRDFMKELFYFNNLPPEKQKSIKKGYAQ